MIEVVTLRDVCANVAERYFRAYGDDHIQIHGPRTWRQIHAELVALGPEPDAASIEAAIGNGSWTRLSCDACEATGLSVVIDIGQERGYGSSTARVCLACLTKAHDLAHDEMARSGHLKPPPPTA